MASWWGSFVREGTPESQLDPALHPLRHELVLRKDTYSAFRNTSLDRFLKKRAARTVVLCGTMTHICVDTTARDAFLHGYDVVVVEDACAAKHASLHDASLQCLAHAVARVVATNAVVMQLRAGAP